MPLSHCSRLMLPQRCSTPALKLCEPVTYDIEVLM